MPPPPDELRLEPAFDWIAAALPQQNADLFSAFTGVVEIVVSGAGARRITVGAGDTVAQIESDAPSFVRWVTQRGSWDDLGVAATGDEENLAVARQLRVF